jgi:predicted lipoprotein
MKSLLTLCVLVTLFSCGKSDSGDTTNPATGSDSVLISLGTDVILPSYKQLSADAVTLDAAVTAFNAAPSTSTLTTVQTAFAAAYTSWAACSEFEFGPAADAFLTTHFTNAFPTDTNIIKNNIAGTAYSIDGLGNYAAQGFPAMDYLLFAYGTDMTLARFSAAGAKSYLAALSASLKAKSATVVTAWTNTYLATFKAATGVNSGSSLSLLGNSYVQDFDVNLQNYKIGIPIGVYGPTVLPKAPTKVEAYYSGLSDQLLVAQIQAIKNIYLHGIDKKVIASKAQYNGGSLNDAVVSQMNAVLTKFQALPTPLSTGIENNSADITAAFTEVRKLTVLLKSDMSSAIGIKISFQDDDGD